MSVNEKVLACPVCGAPVEVDEREAFCGNNHHFDRARQGYLNLLCSQSSRQARHGDDRLMVQERTAFLERGYYEPLRQAVADAAVEVFPSRGVLLDCGCGEGYYTEYLCSELAAHGAEAQIIALDISKEAAKRAARRAFEHETVVGSSYALPMLSGSCDLVLCLFSPAAVQEFARVLKENGSLILAVPKERHLFQLKEAIYDQPYENPPVNTQLEGFVPSGRKSVDFTIRLERREDILSLFHMTPYFYKTSREDQEKLQVLDRLDTEISVELLTFRKKGSGPEE